MAADVVAQDPEMRQEIRGLRVPLAMVDPKRVGEHHNWKAVESVQPVVEANVFEADEWHAYFFAWNSIGAMSVRFCRQRGQT
jgi:hypothetical protein